MKKFVLNSGIFLLIIFPPLNCSVKRVNTEEYYPANNPSVKYRLYKDIKYNEFGLPFFENEIGMKPENTVETYHMAIYENGRIVKSIHIGVVDKDTESRDKNPVRIVYEWTGKGFQAGFDITKGILRGGNGNFVYPGTAAGFMIIMAVPIVVTGVGGMFIGILDGTRVALKDLINLFREGHEYFLGYTDYIYDGQNRITEYRIHSPEDKDKIIIKAVFVYGGNAKNPGMMKIRNINDKADTIIRFR